MGVGEAREEGGLEDRAGAGRPVLAAVSADSETGRFISRRQVGIVVPPEDPGALAQAIRRLRSNRDYADSLGRNARAAAEKDFDRDLVLKKFEQHLVSLKNPKFTSLQPPASEPTSGQVAAAPRVK